MAKYQTETIKIERSYLSSLFQRVPPWLLVPKYWDKTSLWKRVVHLFTDKKLRENPKRDQAEVQPPRTNAQWLQLDPASSWHFLPWRDSHIDGNTWVNNRDLSMWVYGEISYSSRNVSKSKGSLFLISTCLGFLVCFVCCCLYKVSLCSPGRPRIYQDSPVGQVWPTKNNVSQNWHDQRKKYMPSGNITWEVAMFLECPGGF